MNIIKRNPKNQDPFFSDLFDWEHPFYGLSLFPSLRKTAVDDNYLPAVDVSEDKEKLVVRADLPGLKKEEIDISVDGSVLTIRGERKSEKEEKDKNFHRIERAYGTFQRSIDLGTLVDENKVKAKYNNGVLEVTLPRTDRKETKRISVE